MALVANLVYLVGAILYSPVLLYQMIFQRKNRRGWRQRFGYVRHYDPAQPRIWVHGVSLGEINATPRLVAELRQHLPAYDVVVSTTTDTGYARACSLYGASNVFRFPLDFSGSVSRVLDRVRPRLIVLVELEVWFNLVRLAERSGVPVVVVNGRMTERSCRRFGWLGGVGRAMFSRLTWVGAQDQVIAERFVRAGVPRDRLEITGSMKWDTAQIADVIDGAENLGRALGVPRDRPLWVCGSTGPGEEPLVLEAYRLLRDSGVDVSLAIVPRKPERFDHVAQLIQEAGYSCTRRSRRPDGFEAGVESGQDAASPGPAIFLGDTMGELRKFYHLASVVFVGRSLVPMGGSDPMEVAALARPIVVGPHMENFQMPVARLTEAGGIRGVSTAEDLSREIARLCSDRSYADRLARAARQVVRENQGATARTAQALARLVHDIGGGSVG
jgi:3-deoxy-D-manno-octulosonic-acid transferase